ncbi:MAG: helix-turn-helix domain-containing protein [Candidatus Eremiobacteraeota bacterium]|nr:helix-turn-helix domain-containing protein [Candidatus Eremiobacteraeota bacterium]
MGSEEERSKLGLLALAKHLRNVTEACKKMGFSRASFYRFQEQYQSGDGASLEEESRHRPIPQNRVDPHIEAAIIELALVQPTWGQDGVAADLRTRGMRVSPGGVRSVWLRHNLETTEKRLQAGGDLKNSDQKHQNETAQADIASSQSRNGPDLSNSGVPRQRAAQETLLVSPDSRTYEIYRQPPRSTANVVGVVALAILACIQLASAFQYTFYPRAYGDYGFSVDFHGSDVVQVTSGLPADKAGVKVGDVINRRLPLRAGEIFWGILPRAGERLTLNIERAGKGRTLTLVASPLRLSSADVVSQAVLDIVALVCFAIGAFLALVRPSRMTWGFYLSECTLIWVTGGNPQYLSPSFTVLYVLTWIAVVTAGVLGYAVFCLRFPSNTVTGWRKTVEKLFPIVFLVFVVGNWLQTLGAFFDVVPPAYIGIWQTVWDIILILFGILGVISLAGTYLSSGALERYRIKWVLFGVTLLFIGIVVAAVQFQLQANGWQYAAAESLIVAFPLSVAYAVIRHRVIDIRFVVNRALVLGLIAAAIGVIVVVLDWLFSTKFANSRLQTAVYAGIALLVGMSVNTARQRISVIVDRLFFRHWYRTEMQSTALGDLIHRATSRTDLYELLTAGIANAYSLASIALLERLADGGLVRVAAQGWPTGTLWHVLPDDVVAKRVGSLRLTNLDAINWTEQALPAGAARPSVMISIAVGKLVPAILLCGAHENGTALDPDEIRSIRRLCAGAGLVYGIASQGLEKATVPVQRGESLGAQSSAPTFK